MNETARLRIAVITLFPDLFGPFLESGILGRAIERGLIGVELHDLRAHGLGRHRTVDDSPYGGGAGMVMRPEPLTAAITPLRDAGASVILLDPAGERLTDRVARELAGQGQLALVCGRYEGVDERVRTVVDRELSIGDYVLSGGEVAAMVVIDAVSRLVPGVIDPESPGADSFADGLLEHPHYTRPETFNGLPVPAVLLSGHHGEVAAWRRQAALQRTLQRRPDLLADADLTDADRAALERLRTETPDASG